MALTMDLPTAEEAAISGGTFLELPGKYHVSVIHAEENAMRGDTMVKGFMFEVAAHATESDAAHQAEITKTIKLYFGNGDPAHKDGGKFAQSKQVAALIAANVISPSDLGKKGLKIDIESAKNHQFFVQLELGKAMETGKNVGKRYLDLAFAHIYHIDDPRAKAYPRSAELLEFAKDFRRNEAFFEPIIKAKPAPQKRVTDDDLAGL